jgi:hypothetical protein
VLTRESAYIAFPLDIANESFSYGNQVGWVNPAKDELPGGSREWYVARHWAAVAGGGAAVTMVPVDAPLVAFGDIVRGNWPAEFKPKSSAVFSWLMNNYWGTNFPAWQGGDYTFRYVLTSGATVDPAAWTRFGIEVMTRLEVTQVPQAPGESRLPLDQAGLVEIDGEGVNLSTWKMAEDGQGSVLRLQETAGRTSRLPPSIPLAVRCTWSPRRCQRSIDWRCRVRADAVEWRALSSRPSRRHSSLRRPRSCLRQADRCDSSPRTSS